MCEVRHWHLGHFRLEGYFHRLAGVPNLLGTLR